MAKRDRVKQSNTKSKESTPKIEQNQSKPSNSMAWLLPLLLALGITAVLYLPTLSYEYVNWDDDVNIMENPNLENDISASTFRDIFSLEKGPVIGNYNPLPIASFALEKMVSSTNSFDPGVTHAFNLILHLLVVFFVFQLIIKLGLNYWSAFVGALLFGIHPMRVESVTWATERKDVLFALFFFWALNYYVRWLKAEEKGESRGKILIFMVIFAFLSLFSKVQAVTLPLSMLAIDYWFKRDISFKLIWEKTIFWLMSLGFGLINIYTLGQNNSLDDSLTGYSFGQRILVGLYSFCVYLYKLVLPAPMSPLYPYPKEMPMMMFVTPFIFIGIWIGIYLLAKRNKMRPLVFGMLFFFFNVVFMLQILGAGQGFLADRFTYVPYFGFFFVAAYYFEKFYAIPERKGLATGIAALFFMMCAFVTFKQNPIWQNGETLWTKVIEEEGKTIETPWGNRAYYYRELGEYEKALADYDVAINLPSKHKNSYNSRGKTYFDMAMSGKFKDRTNDLRSKAIKDYQDGLKQDGLKDKEKSELLINLGAAVASTNNFEAALGYLNQGAEIAPDNKNAFLNRSLVYFNLHQFDKAIEDQNKILELDPNYLDIYYERGMCRRILNRNEEALKDLNYFIARKQDMGFAYVERGRVYLGLRKQAEARADLQKAMQLGVEVDQVTKTAAGL